MKYITACPDNVNSENVYISGDNIDGLKHLLKSYAGGVKCIYIDPPYNTGTDGFVYNDKFEFTAGDLMTKLSIDEEQAGRILDLTKRGVRLILRGLCLYIRDCCLHVNYFQKTA